MTAILAQSHLSGIVITNLMNIWNQATLDERRRGRDWYFGACRTVGKLAGKYSLPPATVAGIIAALSPGMEWTRNLEESERFIRSKGDGQYGVYGRRNDDKARAILAHPAQSPLDVLGGPKTRAFYSCIMDPTSDEHVVVDSHMWCAGLNRTNDRWARSTNQVRVTEARSWWLARHIIHCARIVGLYPSEFQAIVWLTWKRLMEEAQ